MTQRIGFPPVAHVDARLLILGSLPGVESLRQQQYYAKPQNSFWRIMGVIAGAAPELPYAARLQCLQDHHIALWDVCHAAERAGSLDSAIKNPQPNDFVQFFAAHPALTHICFNGQPAAKLFTHLVKPQLAREGFTYAILPSTSPAHAGMRFEEKLARWQRGLASAPE